MYLCVDRIEGNTVVLLDDEEKLYHMDVPAYVALVGRKPAESDVLTADVVEGSIRSAAYDEAETQTRKAAARARLSRLFGKK